MHSMDLDFPKGFVSKKQTRRLRDRLGLFGS
jgi:hypothetical protein